MSMSSRVNSTSSATFATASKSFTTANAKICHRRLKVSMVLLEKMRIARSLYLLVSVKITIRSPGELVRFDKGRNTESSTRACCQAIANGKRNSPNLQELGAGADEIEEARIVEKCLC